MPAPRLRKAVVAVAAILAVAIVTTQRPASASRPSNEADEVQAIERSQPHSALRRLLALWNRNQVEHESMRHRLLAATANASVAAKPVAAAAAKPAAAANTSAATKPTAAVTPPKTTSACTGRNKKMCGKVCVDIFTDRNNCGGCGKKVTGLNRLCDTGRSFTWPQDSPPCPKNRIVCGGQCTDVKNDVNHCGFCTNRCAKDQQCVAGACKTVTAAAPVAKTLKRIRCPISKSILTGTSYGYYAADSSNQNCGACGVGCPLGSYCEGAQCTCHSHKCHCMIRGQWTCIAPGAWCYGSKPYWKCPDECPSDKYCGNQCCPSKWDVCYDSTPNDGKPLTCDACCPLKRYNQAGNKCCPPDQVPCKAPKDPKTCCPECSESFCLTPAGRICCPNQQAGTKCRPLPNNQSVCCTDALWTGPPANKCCSSATARCKTGATTFECCNEKWQACLPLANTLNKCCMKNDIVCGNECCRQGSRCYNSDGTPGVDACCPQGSFVYPVTANTTQKQTCCPAGTYGYMNGTQPACCDADKYDFVNKKCCPDNEDLCDMGASQVCCSKTSSGGTCQTIQGWGNMCCPTRPCQLADGIYKCCPKNSPCKALDGSDYSKCCDPVSNVVCGDNCCAKGAQCYNDDTDATTTTKCCPSGSSVFPLNPVSNTTKQVCCPPGTFGYSSESGPACCAAANYDNTTATCCESALCQTGANSKECCAQGTVCKPGTGLFKYSTCCAPTDTVCGQQCCDFTGVTNPRCWLDANGNPQSCPVSDSCVDDSTNPNFNCNATVPIWERKKWKCCNDTTLGIRICTQLGTDDHCSDCNACPANKKCEPSGKSFQCVCATSKGASCDANNATTCGFPTPNCNLTSCGCECLQPNCGTHCCPSICDSTGQDCCNTQICGARCCANSTDQCYDIDGNGVVDSCCPSVSTVYTATNGTKQVCCANGTTPYTDRWGVPKCCAAGLWNANQCCSSSNDKCEVAENTYQCCNPWKESCKNLTLSQGLQKCCLKDDIVCGDECCRLGSKCFNSDGNNGVDSCCPQGSSVYPSNTTNRQTCCPEDTFGYMNGTQPACCPAERYDSANKKCCPEGEDFCLEGTKQVCCSQSTNGGTCKNVAGWGSMCCQTELCQLAASVWWCCPSNMPCKTLDGGDYSKCCDPKSNVVCGDSCCAKGAQCYNDDDVASTTTQCCPSGSSVFPPNPVSNTTKQICCPAGFNGYFNGTDPACCPTAKYNDAAGTCCAQDMCQTSATTEVCCSGSTVCKPGNGAYSICCSPQEKVCTSTCCAATDKCYKDVNGTDACCAQNNFVCGNKCCTVGCDATGQDCCPGRMCGATCCANSTDNCYKDAITGADSCCPSNSTVNPETGTKQVCCANGTTPYTNSWGVPKCCAAGLWNDNQCCSTAEYKCQVASGSYTCCNPWKETCRNLTQGLQKCCAKTDQVCGDECCSQYATCYNSDGTDGVDSCCPPGGEPFPLNTTVRQTCCLAGTEGYFNGTEPACCPDEQFDRYHRCCPSGEDLCSTADGEVCCSLKATNETCQIVGSKGGSDDVCCTADRWTGTECCTTDLCQTANGAVCCGLSMACVPTDNGTSTCCMAGEEWCAGACCRKGKCYSSTATGVLDTCCPDGSYIYPQNTTGKQVCCNWRSEKGYMNGTEPACCAKSQLDVYGKCCPDSEALCSTVNKGVCCSLSSKGSCRPINGTGGNDDVCCTDDYWASADNKCCDSDVACDTQDGKICCKPGTKCYKGYGTNNTDVCCAEDQWVQADGQCCSIFPVPCGNGDEKCCGAAELCQIDVGNNKLCCPQGKWTGDSTKTCCSGSTVPVKCKARTGDSNPPTKCCEEEVACEYNENIGDYACVVASCANVKHCATGQQTGIFANPSCCCKQCTDGFTAECNPFNTTCDENNKCGCKCTGLTCNANTTYEICCPTSNYCYDKDGKAENGQEACCPAALWTGKPTNPCCSSEASKCLTAKNSYTCCDPWEACKTPSDYFPLLSSLYSKCCDKDQKLCGTECCSQDATCYYPNGVFKPASCCKAGWIAFPSITVLPAALPLTFKQTCCPPGQHPYLDDYGLPQCCQDVLWDDTNNKCCGILEGLCETSDGSLCCSQLAEPGSCKYVPGELNNVCCPPGRWSGTKCCASENKRCQVGVSSGKPVYQCCDDCCGKNKTCTTRDDNADLQLCCFTDQKVCGGECCKPESCYNNTAGATKCCPSDSYVFPNSTNATKKVCCKWNEYGYIDPDTKQPACCPYGYWTDNRCCSEALCDLGGEGVCCPQTPAGGTCRPVTGKTYSICCTTELCHTGPGNYECCGSKTCKGTVDESNNQYSTCCDEANWVDDECCPRTPVTCDGSSQKCCGEGEECHLFTNGTRTCCKAGNWTGSPTNECCDYEGGFSPVKCKGGPDSQPPTICCVDSECQYNANIDPSTNQTIGYACVTACPAPPVPDHCTNRTDPWIDPPCCCKVCEEGWTRQCPLDGSGNLNTTCDETGGAGCECTCATVICNQGSITNEICCTNSTAQCYNPTGAADSELCCETGKAYDSSGDGSFDSCCESDSSVFPTTPGNNAQQICCANGTYGYYTNPPTNTNTACCTNGRVVCNGTCCAQGQNACVNDRCTGCDDDTDCQTNEKCCAGQCVVFTGSGNFNDPCCTSNSNVTACGGSLTCSNTTGPGTCLCPNGQTHCGNNFCCDNGKTCYDKSGDTNFDSCCETNNGSSVFPTSPRNGVNQTCCANGTYGYYTNSANTTTACCPNGSIVCNNVCCDASQQGCSATGACVQCDADADCGSNGRCCNGQCITNGYGNFNDPCCGVPSNATACGGSLTCNSTTGPGTCLCPTNQTRCGTTGNFCCPNGQTCRDTDGNNQTDACCPSGTVTYPTSVGNSVKQACCNNTTETGYLINSTTAGCCPNAKWDNTTSKCCSEDLCPTSISRRRSLLVVPTTVKKCCPDLGTGQTCKFATGSSVGVCCTTALWVENQCCTSPKKVCKDKCCDLCDNSTNPTGCCPPGRTICNNTCCADGQKGCSATGACVQCDADADCTGGQICCGNQCVNPALNANCGGCTACPSNKQCTNVTGTFQCLCQRAAPYNATCDASNPTGCSGRSTCNLTDCSCKECSQVPADVYFLADNTGTMTAYIDGVRNNANLILTNLSMSVQNLYTGGGAYRDKSTSSSNWPGGQNQLFYNMANLTNGTTAANTAINTWSARSNTDYPEAQLYALFQLSNSSSSFGWRANATKILLWFGDYPGKNPICTGFLSTATSTSPANPAFNIDLPLVITNLKKAQIKVIALSVGDNLLDASTQTAVVNGQPRTVNSQGCPASGSCSSCVQPNPLPKQAKQITTETGGELYSGISPSTIVEVIINSLYNATCPATVGS